MRVREVFPNAPLEFVAAEMRFPYAPRVGRNETFDKLVELLADVFPIPERDERQSMTSAPESAPKAEASVAYRLLARDKRSSVTISPSSASLELTDYVEYVDFRALFERMLQALDHLQIVVGVERLGLRFIDEIRVPDVASPLDWRGYIAEDLLGPLVMADHGEVSRLEGVLQLKTGAQTRLALRYATLSGSGIVGGGPLRRRHTPNPGPFFAIDSDSYLDAEDILEFDIPALLAHLDVLHDPIGDIFHRSITERLKEEVLRRQPEGGRQ